ncbi:MAG: class I SAM-dependent methyltransferase [Candidatus Helarchaeota archaeon]|nr:class I SAM-dependent methyltransferase [Candidatus Helarchaeota archaeon]
MDDKFSIINGKIILDTNLAPLHPINKLLYETIYNLNPKSILEIGCGAGDSLVNLKKILPETEIYGCDLSKKQLEFLNNRHPKLKNFTNIFIHDVTTSLLNLKVELSFTISVFMHIQRRHQYLNALRNIFHASEKYVLLSENWRRHNFFNDLKKIVNEPDFPWKNVNFYKVFSGETLLILISNKKVKGYEELKDSKEILEFIY